MIVFLNELSVASVSLSTEHAVASVRQLIDVLRDLRNYRGGLSINAASPIREHRVDPDKTVQDVLRGNAFKEEWMFLRRLADRSPMADGLPAPKALEDFEYRFQNVEAIALGWAHLLKTAAVSFCYDECWRHPELPLECTELTASGKLEPRDGCTAKNFSRIHHIAHWDQWLKDYASEEVPAPQDLWAQRDEIFHNLRFLDRVRGDLEAMGQGEPAYKQAVVSLQRLSIDLKDWGGVGVPIFSTKVTGEGEQRKKLCMVTDIDDKTHCFDLHARFTGGIPGRIHFRMSPAEAKAVVAYVGFKLDAPIT